MSNLKKLRLKAGLTFQGLGDRCGFSKAHMYALENGKHSPAITTAYAVAKVLGVSVYTVWPDETEIVEETITVRRIIKEIK